MIYITTDGFKFAFADYNGGRLVMLPVQLDHEQVMNKLDAMGLNYSYADMSQENAKFKYIDAKAESKSNNIETNTPSYSYGKLESLTSVLGMEKDLKNLTVPTIKTILDKAKDIIYTDREGTYGNPGKNLRNIAELWSTYLDYKISPDDVCLMMALLKIARLMNNPKHEDSKVDICGYIALLDRL